MMHQAYGLSMSGPVIIPPPLFQLFPRIRKGKGRLWVVSHSHGPARLFSNHQEISADRVGQHISQNQIGCAGTQHIVGVGQRGIL